MKNRYAIAVICAILLMPLVGFQCEGAQRTRELAIETRSGLQDQIDLLSTKIEDREAAGEDVSEHRQVLAKYESLFAKADQYIAHLTSNIDEQGNVDLMQVVQTFLPPQFSVPAALLLGWLGKRRKDQPVLTKLQTESKALDETVRALDLLRARSGIVASSMSEHKSTMHSVMSDSTIELLDAMRAKG